MRKLMVSLLILCLLCCSGCAKENLESRAEQGLIEYEDFTYDVVADEETHIMYIYYCKGNNGYMTPYYSKNGKLCRYEDGKIIEVNTDE